MLRVVIIGTGNVATHLCNAFSQTEEVAVVQVVGRNKEQLKKFPDFMSPSHTFTAIAEADVYVIAVKDEAIPRVSTYLSAKKGIVVHTSGAMAMDCLAATNRGVFYPLQTFTVGRAVDFSAIPLCIEAQNPTSLAVVQQLAGTLSKKVYEITSEQRKMLHLAAVFVNNFSNHLYYIGEMLCQQEGLPFALLQPLLLETALKVQSLSPTEAQTGPARRGDQKSIQTHLNRLHNTPYTELYTAFSNAIQQRYEKKL